MASGLFSTGSLSVPESKTLNKLLDFTPVLKLPDRAIHAGMFKKMRLRFNDFNTILE